jgi:hypothetical protein
MKQSVLTLLLLLFSNFAMAGLYFEISLEEGGDKVSSISEYSIYGSNVNLGGGFKMGGGYYMSMGEEARNSLSLSLGYLSSENRDAEFKTTTFDAIYCYQVNSHRFGIGAAYHIEPEVNGEFRGVSSNGLDFDDSTGLILQYSFELMRGFSVGLRYTDMEYEVNDDSFDASSVGFFFGLYEDFRDW